MAVLRIFHSRLTESCDHNIFLGNVFHGPFKTISLTADHQAKVRENELLGKTCVSVEARTHSCEGPIV